LLSAHIQPNNKMKHLNISKIRYKKLAWMRKSWPTWIYMVDAFSLTCPKYARIDAFGYTHINLKGCKARLCKGSNDWSNGPPL